MLNSWATLKDSQTNETTLRTTQTGYTVYSAQFSYWKLYFPQYPECCHHNHTKEMENLHQPGLINTIEVVPKMDGLNK